MSHGVLCVPLALLVPLYLFTVILSTPLHVSQTCQDVSYLGDSARLLFMPQSILPSPFLHIACLSLILQVSFNSHFG